jgi:hypothetical protein
MPAATTAAGAIGSRGRCIKAAPTGAAECNTPSSLGGSKLDFTRALFSKNGRVHTESRCNQCGFRIIATTCDSFANEEQEHARACRGSVAE